jgi:hypothetical protein
MPGDVISPDGLPGSTGGLRGLSFGLLVSTLLIFASPLRAIMMILFATGPGSGVDMSQRRKSTSGYAGSRWLPIWNSAGPRRRANPAGPIAS